MTIDCIWTNAASTNIDRDDIELLRIAIRIALIHNGKRKPLWDEDDKITDVGVIQMEALDTLLSGMDDLILARWTEEQQRIYNLEKASSEARKESSCD